MLAKCDYEFCIYKALEINPVLVKLGWVQREMHLMVRHHLLHIPYNSEPTPALGCECKLVNKGNVVLYLDKELVEKSKELEFNLSKTFENHLKQLISGYSPVSIQNNGNLSESKSALVGLSVPYPNGFKTVNKEKN